MPCILIVDDDVGFRESLAETLGDLGHEIVEAGTARQAMLRLREGGVDAAFIDFRMPDRDGLALLKDIRSDRALAGLPVVMLTAFATPTNTIEAMQLGAVDHLTKPAKRDDIVALLPRLLQQSAEPPPDEADIPEHVHLLIGSCPEMRKVQKSVGMAAASDHSVLVRGETGTGKEVVARALHAYSQRANRPFIALNCAAVPSSLIESELFGHTRGSFTGAIADRLGAFREASGGTLFLDEIGDMEPAMQAKLLRVIEERVVAPVGSSRPVTVDVRLIAATHRDLPRRTADGLFREDLLYRINVVTIDLPPLRERGEDIVALAEYFLRRTNSERARGLTPAARRRLLAHPWPGNVRELKHAMERASLVARNRDVDSDDLGFLDLALQVDVAGDSANMTLPEAVRALEREMIGRALANSGNNKADAARRLGISRQQLYAKLTELNDDKSSR